jgi:cystathionine gamma-synthase
MHSGTKYLAGHSDALLGLLTASPVTIRGRELAPILKKVQIMAGGVASPWDSWLALRGIRTLQVRVERQSRTALALAEFLFKHEFVTAVHYPGLSHHPSHHVARSQMSTFGGVFSLELESEQAAMAFAAALSTIKRATSLGGTETLIEHRASIEPPERRTSPPGLLRVSVGLEDEDDLIQDITMAMDIARQVMQGKTF